MVLASDRFIVYILNRFAACFIKPARIVKSIKIQPGEERLAVRETMSPTSALKAGARNPKANLADSSQDFLQLSPKLMHT